MKFLIFIFVVDLLSVESALVCISSSNTDSGTVPPQNQSCSDDVKFCMSADVKYQGVEIKYRACNGMYVPGIPGLACTFICTATGTRTMNATDLTGEIDCCDSNLCNTKSLNPDKKLDNSAIKPFSFGFASLFVILALLF